MKLASLCCLLVLTACNLAPRYHRPKMEIPTSWRVNAVEGNTLANVHWWEYLDDSVLDTLIQTALKNNKDLQTAMWRVQEFYGKYMIARSGYFPQVNLDTTAARQRISEEANFVPPGTNPIMSDYTALLNVSYEIDFWGQVRNTSYAAYEQYLAQVENRRTVVLTLVSAVAQAYIILRQFDMQYEISKMTFETRKESLQIAIDRFEGGVTSEIEVAQAESAYEEALAAVKVYERQIPQQENLISVLLGQNPGPIPRGKTIDLLFLPLGIPAGLPSDLLTRRPDIVKAEDILKSANANIGIARAAFFPQISLTGLYGVESFELKNLFTHPATTWQMAANAFQQIFTGGRLSGQLKVAKAQQKEALFQYEQTILNAFAEVDDALIGHEKAKEIVVVQQADVAALTEYLTLAWLRYYEGQTQYLTVLDAERELFTAQLNLAQAQADQFTTLVDIFKSLGGGWVIDADAHLKREKQ